MGGVPISLPSYRRAKGRILCRVVLGKDSHSASDHTWSVNPAAIAAVLGRYRYGATSCRSVRTGRQ